MKGENILQFQKEKLRETPPFLAADASRNGGMNLVVGRHKCNNCLSRSTVIHLSVLVLRKIGAFCSQFFKSPMIHQVFKGDFLVIRLPVWERMA